MPCGAEATLTSSFRRSQGRPRVSWGAWGRAWGEPRGTPGGGPWTRRSVDSRKRPATSARYAPACSMSAVAARARIAAPRPEHFRRASPVQSWRARSPRPLDDVRGRPFRVPARAAHRKPVRTTQGRGGSRWPSTAYPPRPWAARQALPVAQGHDAVATHAPLHDDGPGAGECFEVPVRRWRAESHARRACELLDARHAAMRAQVRRRRALDSFPGREASGHDKRAVGRRDADAQREVNAVGEQVDHAIVGPPGSSLVVLRVPDRRQAACDVGGHPGQRGFSLRSVKVPDAPVPRATNGRAFSQSPGSIRGPPLAHRWLSPGSPTGCPAGVPTLLDALRGEPRAGRGEVYQGTCERRTNPWTSAAYAVPTKSLQNADGARRGQSVGVR